MTDIPASAPLCAAPDPNPKRPQIIVPSGACDCHAHICGPMARHAYAPERIYTLRGALYALWGGTSVPSSVNFRCVHCGVIFDQRSDLATRRQYII